MRDLIILKLEMYARGAQWLKPLYLCSNDELLELYTDLVVKKSRTEAIGNFIDA